jgi:hypothetical protein
MIEKDIEKTLQDKCLAALETRGVRIHPISPLSSIAAEQIEKSTADGFLVVSVQPRSYDTPMVPSCTISATVSLLVRAEMTEIDFGSLVEKLVNLFDRWQACLDDVHGPFSTASFQLAGFRLGSGEIGVDHASRTYTYSHTLDFIGVVQR